MGEFIMKDLKKFLFIMFLIWITLGLGCTNKNENNKLELTQKQINTLKNLETKGLLSIEPDLNKAYIDPDLWSQMNAKLKEDFSASLAIYCGNKKGTRLYWVEIYDKQSGKKLAKYSQTWGFKVY